MRNSRIKAEFSCLHSVEVDCTGEIGLNIFLKLQMLHIHSFPPRLELHGAAGGVVRSDGLLSRWIEMEGSCASLLPVSVVCHWAPCSFFASHGYELA